MVTTKNTHTYMAVRTNTQKKDRIHKNEVNKISFPSEKFYKCEKAHFYC